MAETTAAEEKPSAKDPENPERNKSSFLIGGLWLNIDRSPAELLAWYRKEKKEKSLRPSPMLLLMWQRCAIHFSYLQDKVIPELRTQIDAQAETIKDLSARLAKLERRGS